MTILRWLRLIDEHFAASRTAWAQRTSGEVSPIAFSSPDTDRADRLIEKPRLQGSDYVLFILGGGQLNGRWALDSLPMPQQC